MARRFLYLWLALLALSNGWRLAHPPIASPGDGQRAVTVKERNGTEHTERDITIAYSEYGKQKPNQPSILLLHGTPIASAAMRDLAIALSATHHVISPDLPGFAASMQLLSDYSSITHGAYLADLIEALAISRVHVAAYSQGGAAALALSDVAPDTVASVSLLSAIGVQELELFGSYELNHAVYAGQLGVLRAAQWLLPHFGYLDNAILGPGYARNLYDTDQRLLRPMLLALQAPTLIVHGEDDGLVPLAAANEHHRLVPHSELSVISGGHEIVYAQPKRIVPILVPFLNRVEQGSVITRAGASTMRQAAAAAPAVPAPREPLLGGALIVLMLAIIVASYVSEDLTCIAAGILVAQGVLTFPTAVLACLIGLFSGDIALFAAGRWLGPPALRRFVSDSKLEQAKLWLQRRGPWVIVASRFTPGTRLPTYVAAGALRMPFRRFIGYFAIATALWTPLLVGVAAAYGEVVNSWFARYATLSIWLLIAGVIVLWLLIKMGLPALTWRGRRLIYSRWQRLTHFEFWPRSAFYPPIVLYCAWLAIRYRSATLFTLANPGMPLAGLIGESKQDILRALESSGAAATCRHLDGANDQQRLESLERFMATHALSFPIVLKPDQGQRGQDVLIANSRDEAVEYIRGHDNKTIAQRFVAGQEFGVFYIRLPEQPEGFIYSITRKEDTTVIGDGTRTLSELILADDRAVRMANYFLKTHATRLANVPERGEKVALNTIGTHSRGSLFTDAGDLASDALTAEIDRISRCFEGFYFGRYDLIVDSDTALARGENLTIIELNGVSSEATHIYDPQLSVFNAWRVIARQWRYAWQIGEQLRAQGLRPASALDILRTLRNNL